MKGIIAIVDALGVSTYSIEQSKQFLKDRNEIISDIVSMASSTAKNIEENYIPSIFTFGDTLVFSWEAADDESDRLAGTVWIGTWVRYLMILGIHKGLLFRGAMSYGEFISEENTILGPAVADAAAWYEAADWFGVICTPSMQFMLNSLSVAHAKDDKTGSMLAWFMRYSVPMKNSAPKNLWTIPWPYDIWERYYDEGQNKEDSKLRATSAINILLTGQSVPRGTEDKFTNSIQYFEYCIEKYFKNDKTINDVSLYKKIKAEALRKELEEEGAT